MHRAIFCLVIALAASTMATGPSAQTQPAAQTKPAAQIRPAAQTAAPVPKLVLQITIDQLRGDLPIRYQRRFGKGGFRYFLTQGTWYAAANHSHAHTETIVGHGTLATGAHPSRHGLVGDKAFARQSADHPEEKFCGSQTTNQGAPTAAPPAAPAPAVPPGATPETILTTTFSDELMLATAGRAKVFGVSWKDRAAVPMAGHVGKAFWFSTGAGCFISSSYYYSTYPQWLTSWCGTQPADKYQNATWDLLYDKSTYVYRDQTNQYPGNTAPEMNMQMLEGFQFGRTFPHKVAAGKAFYNALSISPFGDELTLAFAKELVQREQIGKDDVTDYLSISFSATDLNSHWFGPSSLESEDNILRLDRTLENLLSYIDKEVGLRNTIVVLAGDHGAADYPEYLQTQNVATGRVSTQKIRDAATAALKTRFGIDGIVAEYSHPWFYLCHNVIDQNKLDPAEVERVIARAALKVDGVALAIPESDPHSIGLDNDAQTVALIRNSYHPRRSGSVHIVQSPQWQVDDSSTQGPLLLSHGSPWAYDTHVPVAFAGASIRPAMVYRGISTVDVAPTLAAYLRTKCPSGCVGAPLAEVMAGR